MQGIPVLLAIILVLVTSSFLLILQRNTGRLIPNAKTANKNREPTFVIAGPSYSGKTCLYNLLTMDKLRNTVMSQEPSVTHSFKLPGSPAVRLMEFPGHLKLRGKLLTELKNSTNIKGLIYVIDSTVDPKELTKTAEFLFQIIQLTEREKNGVDILLACNKSDSFAARQPLKIKSVLETEIEKIIQRKRNSLDTVSGSLNRTNEGEDKEESEWDNMELFESANGFRFEVLEGNVDAFEGSVSKRNIGKWDCWIRERAVN